MSFRPHFRCKVSVLLVNYIVTIGKHRHGFYWECKDVLCTLSVEPLHESFLKIAQRVPNRLTPVRERKITEYSLKITLIKISYIPKDSLITTSTCRHIHRMYHLLEAIINNLSNGSFLSAQIYYFINSTHIVITIILTDKIIHVHKELRCSNSSSKLTSYRVNQINELTAETL